MLGLQDGGLGGCFGNSGWVGVQAPPSFPPWRGGMFGGEWVGAKGARGTILLLSAFGEWVTGWVGSNSPPAVSVGHFRAPGFPKKLWWVGLISPPAPPPCS